MGSSSIYVVRSADKIAAAKQGKTSKDIIREREISAREEKNKGNKSSSPSKQVYATPGAQEALNKVFTDSSTNIRPSDKLIETASKGTKETPLSSDETAKTSPIVLREIPPKPQQPTYVTPSAAEAISRMSTEQKETFLNSGRDYKVLSADQTINSTRVISKPAIQKQIRGEVIASSLDIQREAQLKTHTKLKESDITKSLGISKQEYYEGKGIIRKSPTKVDYAVSELQANLDEKFGRNQETPLYEYKGKAASEKTIQALQDTRYINSIDNKNKIKNIEKEKSFDEKLINFYDKVTEKAEAGQRRVEVLSNIVTQPKGLVTGKYKPYEQRGFVGKYSQNIVSGVVGGVPNLVYIAGIKAPVSIAAASFTLKEKGTSGIKRIIEGASEPFKKPEFWNTFNPTKPEGLATWSFALGGGYFVAKSKIAKRSSPPIQPKNIESYEPTPTFKFEDKVYSFKGNEKGGKFIKVNNISEALSKDTHTKLVEEPIKPKLNLEISKKGKYTSVTLTDLNKGTVRSQISEKPSYGLGKVSIIDYPLKSSNKKIKISYKTISFSKFAEEPKVVYPRKTIKVNVPKILDLKESKISAIQKNKMRYNVEKSKGVSKQYLQHEVYNRKGEYISGRINISPLKTIGFKKSKKTVLKTDIKTSATSKLNYSYLFLESKKGGKAVYLESDKANYPNILEGKTTHPKDIIKIGDTGINLFNNEPILTTTKIGIEKAPRMISDQKSTIKSSSVGKYSIRYKRPKEIISDIKEKISKPIKGKRASYQLQGEYQSEVAARGYNFKGIKDDNILGAGAYNTYYFNSILSKSRGVTPIFFSKYPGVLYNKKSLIKDKNINKIGLKHIQKNNVRNVSLLNTKTQNKLSQKLFSKQIQRSKQNLKNITKLKQDVSQKLKQKLRTNQLTTTLNKFQDSKIRTPRSYVNINPTFKTNIKTPPFLLPYTKNKQYSVNKNERKLWRGQRKWPILDPMTYVLGKRKKTRA